jgi:hypothetical protein
MLKPFLPQLQRTFVKSLSETGSTPAMRNKTAQCLSLLIPLQARLDPLVMELVQGIKQADAQVKKAIWEALFGLLQGVSRDSGKSLNESSHANIESLLLEAALESGEYDASERLGAAKCFGSYCQVLSIENAQSLVMNLSEDIGSKEWVKVQGVLMCLENVVRFALPIIDDSLQSRFVEVTVFGLKSTKTPLIETAIQVALELIDKSLHSQELIETLIQVSQTSTESTDARRDAITCIKNLAKRNHKVILFYDRISSHSCPKQFLS